METKDREKKENKLKETVMRKANKASDGAASDRESMKGASDEQASAQSEYERGFREGSQHAARWYSQRNFEREQNSFGEYNPAYNPSGMNTERSSNIGSDRYSGHHSERSGYRDQGGYSNQQRENPDYRNRNAGPSGQQYPGSEDRGGGYSRGYSDSGYYQGARQSYPNQDRYDPDRDYDDLRRNPDHEDQQRGYVDPDRGGYEEGGYDYRNRPSGHEQRGGYRPEQGLSGRTEDTANRYGASPRDYEEARRDYGRRSNYDSPSPGTNFHASSDDRRDFDRRGEDKRHKRRDKGASGTDHYDDPYRDYDWSSRNRDV